MSQSARIRKSAFREYDIRGIIEEEIPLSGVSNLTKAIAHYFLTKNPNAKTVAVGMDGRTHSPIIHNYVCDALTECGLDVISFGLCTSPALYFSLYTLDVDAGIMITASHNPKEYNGFKICLGHTFLWGKDIQEIRRLYESGITPTNCKSGHYSTYPIIDDYVKWLADHFAHLKNSDLNIIIDCGNGTAGTVLPKLIEALQWKHVRLIYAEVDGTYPNHEADPVNEKNMRTLKELVLSSGADAGIGFDGDCDRMAPVTSNGFLVPGDQLLALFSQPILRNKPGASIVCDVKSSSGLFELLEEWGATIHMVPTGHANIKDTIKKENAMLGGELSCHFFFNDRYFGYDDALYAGLRLAELSNQSGKTLSELLTVFPKKHTTQEFRIPCEGVDTKNILDHLKAAFTHNANAQLILIDGIRATMPYGWGIVRASNTQPVLSARFESDTIDGLEHTIKDFTEVLSHYIDTDFLQNLENI